MLSLETRHQFPGVSLVISALRWLNTAIRSAPIPSIPKPMPSARGTQFIPNRRVSADSACTEAICPAARTCS